ncbi:hypothetical protein V8D89_007909 [Ganoderma adspersum]
MSPINLWDAESIDSFHRFIFADETARARYIHGLKLPDPYYYGHGFGPGNPHFQTLSDCLVAILRAAVYLEYIYFPTTVDLNPELAAAANMTSLRESPLRSLCIEEGDIHDEGVTPSPERDSVNTAGEMDLLPTATKLADAIPTLQYVFLTNCGCAYEVVPLRMWRCSDRQLVDRWLSSKVWRVARDQDDPHSGSESAADDGAGAVEALCTELSESEAGKVMDREELHLSHDEDDTLRKCSSFNMAGGG